MGRSSACRILDPKFLSDSGGISTCLVKQLIKSLLGDIIGTVAVGDGGVDTAEHLVTIDLLARTVQHENAFACGTLLVIDESLGHKLFSDPRPLRLSVSRIRARRAGPTLAET